MLTRFDEALKQIGLAQRILDPGQVQAAVAQLEELARLGQTYPLGVVLERLNFLAERDRLTLENAARYRVSRDADKGMGRILIDNGYTSAERVEQALQQQKEHYRRSGETIRVGRLLVDYGVITDAQRVAAEKLLALSQAQGAPPPLQ